MMINPSEISSPQFKKRFRGYDCEEVDAHLEQMTSEFTILKNARMVLQQEKEELHAMVMQYREREKALKETMMTAQRVSEELKTNGQKEANLVISRAELAAERIVDEAHRRHGRLVSEISELKRRRMQMIMELKGMLHTHLQMIDMEDEADDGERQTNQMAD